MCGYAAQCPDKEHSSVPRAVPAGAQHSLTWGHLLRLQSEPLGTAGCGEGWARQEGCLYCCCLSPVGTQSSGRSINQREPSWERLNMDWRGLQIFLVCPMDVSSVKGRKKKILSLQRRCSDVYSLQAQKSVTAAKQGHTLEWSCH